MGRRERERCVRGGRSGPLSFAADTSQLDSVCTILARVPARISGEPPKKEPISMPASFSNYKSKRNEHECGHRGRSTKTNQQSLLFLFLCRQYLLEKKQRADWSTTPSASEQRRTSECIRTPGNEELGFASSASFCFTSGA